MKINKEYLRRLLIIAVPIMLSNIISQLQMLIDRIFLGHADDLYMSALSNVTAPMWATMSFCFSIGAGAEPTTESFGKSGQCPLFGTSG